jgi:hypothetical protein
MKKCRSSADFAGLPGSSYAPGQLEFDWHVCTGNTTLLFCKQLPNAGALECVSVTRGFDWVVCNVRAVNSCGSEGNGIVTTKSIWLHATSVHRSEFGFKVWESPAST